MANSSSGSRPASKVLYYTPICRSTTRCASYDDSTLSAYGACGYSSLNGVFS